MHSLNFIVVQKMDPWSHRSQFLTFCGNSSSTLLSRGKKEKDMNFKQDAFFPIFLLADFKIKYEPGFFSTFAEKIAYFSGGYWLVFS